MELVDYLQFDADRMDIWISELYQSYSYKYTSAPCDKLIVCNKEMGWVWCKLLTIA